MLRYFSIALLFGLLITGCNQATDPNNPSGNANELAMTQLTDLPMVGGDVTSIAFLDDNTLVAAIDGKIYTLPAAGGTPTLMHSDAQYTKIVIAPSGEIYAQTTNDLRVIDHIGGTPKVTSVQVTGQFVESTELAISPSGEPFMLVRSYPAAQIVYHSTDKGATWDKLNLPNGFSYGGGITFGASGEIMLSSPNGFYTTTDRGATWSTSPAPLANYGGDMLRTSNGDIYYYVSGGGGLMVSHNGGASFTQLSQFNRSPYFISVQQASDGSLYALANRSSVGPSIAERPMNLLHSTDGGVTWQTVLYVQAHEFAMRGSKIALGVVEGSNHVGAGGIFISQNLGTTWTSYGTKPVATTQDFGFDKDGNLMILAGLDLFRRVGSQWQTLGSWGSARFATTPQGNLLLVSPGASLFSATNGSTWIENAVDYKYGGIGSPQVPVVIGQRNGEFLFSVTTYRDDLYPQTHTNGALYRIGSDGKPMTISSASGHNFVKIIEDKDGVLYAGTVNFSDALKSSDHGTTWEVQAKGTPAIAINSANKFVEYGGLGTLRVGQLGSDATSELKVPGFTSTTNTITSVQFDRNDRLYILTSDKGIFSSQTALQ